MTPARLSSAVMESEISGFADLHAFRLDVYKRQGMDMGIVNAGMLEVYEEIEPELKELVEDVLLNRRSDATERLVDYGEALKGIGKAVSEKKAEEWRNGTVEERLSHALVKGIDTYIDCLLYTSRCV